MKAQRLLAITMLLLNRDSVSAPELARRFEVSARTIYRDMESLCEAGIPVVAYPGAGGGYGIAGGYKLDRSLVRPEELSQISAALASLSEAVGDKRMIQTIDRLKALRAREPRGGDGSYLYIELSPAAREREKIGQLRRAIEERRVARFCYVDGAGASSCRSVESMALVFTWQSWFLYAFCRNREAFRLFKIARLSALEISTERFPPRDVDLDSRPWNKAWAESSPSLPTRLRFSDAARIEEHFDASCIEAESSGSALVKTSLPADEWAVDFLLGLGQSFEVLEPEALRRLVAERASALLHLNG